MVSSSDIEIISNAAIDANGDGDRYTQIMKHLGDKKLLIVAKTVTDFHYQKHDCNHPFHFGKLLHGRPPLHLAGCPTSKPTA